MGGPVGGEHCRLSREGGLLCDCYPRLEASSLLSRAGTARPLPAARLSARLGETRWGSLTPTVNGGPLVGKARLSILALQTFAPEGSLLWGAHGLHLHSQG